MRYAYVGDKSDYIAKSTHHLPYASPTPLKDQVIMNAVCRVLAVGAHPDDIELGCGGTLAKLISQGAVVRAVVLTDGRQGADVEQFNRVEETTRALQHLGVEDIHIAEGFPDTYLGNRLQDLIKYLEHHVKDFDPNVVYTMYDQDRHQDHRAVYDASMVAFRFVPKLYGYETPSCWPQFIPQTHIDVTDFFQKKVEALQMHHSQADRDYTQPEDLSIAAQFRGRQVKRKYCEGFVVYREVN